MIAKKRIVSLLVALIMMLGISPAMPISSVQAAVGPLAENNNTHWLLYSPKAQSYVQHLESAGYGANPGGIVATQDDPSDPAAQWTLTNYNASAIPTAAGMFRMVIAEAANGHAAGLAFKMYDGAVYVEGGINGNADGFYVTPGSASDTVIIRGGGNGGTVYPMNAGAQGLTVNDANILRRSASSPDEFIIIPPQGHVPVPPVPSSLTTPDGSSVTVVWPNPTAYASRLILQRATDGNFADAVTVNLAGAAQQAGYVTRLIDASPKTPGNTYYYRFIAEDYWHKGDNAVVGASASITMPSTLPPTVQTAALKFFKQPVPKDQVIAFDPGFGTPEGATGVASVNIDGAEANLIADSEYTVDWDGRTVTVKADALLRLAEGAHVIHVTFTKGAGPQTFDVGVEVFDDIAHPTSWLIFSPDVGALVGVRQDNPWQANPQGALSATYTSADSAHAQWSIDRNVAAAYTETFPFRFQSMLTTPTPAQRNMSMYGDSWGAWEQGGTYNQATAMAILPQGDGAVKIHGAWNNPGWAAVNADGTARTVAQVASSNFIIVPPDSYIPGNAVNGTVTSETATNVTFTWQAPAGPAPNYFAGFRVFRQDGAQWIEMTDDDALIYRDSGGVYSFTDDAPVDNVSVYKVVTDTANNDSDGLLITANIPGGETPSVGTSLVTFNKKIPEDVVIDVKMGFGSLRATGIASLLLDGSPVAYTLRSGRVPTVVIEAAALSALALANGDAHSIALKFNDAAGTEKAVALNVINAESALPAPQNVKVTGDGNGAVVSWDAVAGATGYKLYRGLGRYAPASFTTQVAVTDAATTTYNLGTDHVWDWYKVTAYNGNGDYIDSPLSDVVSLEITTFPNTEIFTENDAPLTVATVTDNYSRAFFWGGRIGSNSPPGADANNQFTDDRVALLFRPAKGHAADFTYLGMYLNFYMHIAGLGKLPTDVQTQSVQVFSWEGGGYNGGGNVTQNFWRTFENMETMAGGNVFAVSQASPVRRVKTGSLTFQLGGSASGGFLADSYTGWQTYQGQQQFYTRNNAMAGTDGLIWNGVMQGNTTQDGTQWNQSYSWIVVDVAHTPMIAEKPFLYFDVDANDGTGDYKVFVPGYRKDAVGLSWGAGKENGGMGPGESRLLSDFFVANEAMNADQIIAGMKTKDGNIFFTPGVYKLDKEIRVTEPNAVLLGVGEASLRPLNGNVCVQVADVPGVRVAGLLFDAGPAAGNDFANASEALLVVGEGGFTETPEMKASPIVLSDAIIRVGGLPTNVPYKAKNGLIINADYTILDHAWIWRADHGDQVGWTLNQTDNGLVVNGDHVITYGLHAEHFQKYDVLWNGDDGRCFYLQNERPYDPPETDEGVPGAWRDTSLADPKYDYIGPLSERQQGYAAFRVGDDVKNFEGWGLVSYDVFVQNMSVPFRTIWSAFITPAENANIKIHQVGTLSISQRRGEIAHVINGEGPGNNGGVGPTMFLAPNEFHPDNEYWSRLTPSGSEITLGDVGVYDDFVGLSILNRTATARTANAIVASYADGGRLADMMTEQITIKGSVLVNGGVGGNSEIVGGEARGPQPFADKSTAIGSWLSNTKYSLLLPGGANRTGYIWDSETYAPLTESFTIPSN
ncbi:MAG: hypothetical protein LBH86_09590 [Oscillospiraceae bacterium]|jgi:hypothetical protein|nr:hypothetical protein [Oscillospiraceae bacterium]